MRGVGGGGGGGGLYGRGHNEYICVRGVGEGGLYGRGHIMSTFSALKMSASRYMVSLELATYKFRLAAR